MSCPNFDVDYVNGLTHARLIAEFGQGVIERHWTGLYTLDHLGDPQHNPFFRYGVNNNNQEEVAVYLGLAWAFTAGRYRFAVPTWARDEATHHRGRHDYDFITWVDVYSNVNLFGLAGLDGKDRLLASLRGQLRPELATLLAPGDVFVGITIGCDRGTYDSLLVIASGDHRHSRQAIIDEYRRRVQAYENAIDSFHTGEARH